MKVLEERLSRLLISPGDLGYFESINKETIRNALYRYQDMGYLITRRVASSLVPNAGKSPTTLLYAVDPVCETEILTFWDQPVPVGSPYRDTYEFAENNVNPSDGGATSSGDQGSIFRTRLWDLVENVGKYRREGKHRRDNQIAGHRTLRLAKMARMSTTGKAQL